jgi:hypothetical protein
VLASLVSENASHVLQATQVVQVGQTVSEPLQPVPERSLPEVEPIARVDNDNNFPVLENASRGTRCKCNSAQANFDRQSKVPGATGPNDGHIPLYTNNNSRIKPLFANVITQKAVAQQQGIQRSTTQARAVQGHNQSGNQGARARAADSNLTEVTVIRFRGLQDNKEECKFRACNPVEIIQAVQRDLSRQAKNPPAVLSGRWSTTSNTTGNFIYTIAGIIPPHDLMTLKPYLC